MTPDRQNNPLNEPLSFENMTANDFEARLPDLFARYNGHVSDQPELQHFFEQNATCAELVRDLEAIAKVAQDLLRPAEEDPSDAVWDNIQHKLKIAASGEEPE